MRGGLDGPLGDGLSAETTATLAHLDGERAGAGIGRFTGRTRT